MRGRGEMGSGRNGGIKGKKVERSLSWIPESVRSVRH